MPTYRAKKPVKRIDPPLRLTGISAKRYAELKQAVSKMERGVLKGHARVTQVGNRLRWSVHGGWGFRKTSLLYINSSMGLKPTWQIERVIAKKISKYTPNKPLVVVDWGCGSGVAAEQLQTIFKRAPVKVIGYSDVSYPDWEAARKQIDIIWTPKEHLPRFFRKTKIGVVYSHLGLMHLNPIELQAHLTKLAQVMERGAILITDLGKEIRESPTEYIHSIQNAGFRMVALGPDGAAFIHRPKRTSF